MDAESVDADRQFRVAGTDADDVQQSGTVEVRRLDESPDGVLPRRVDSVERDRLERRRGPVHLDVPRGSGDRRRPLRGVVRPGDVEPLVWNRLRRAQTRPDIGVVRRSCVPNTLSDEDRAERREYRPSTHGSVSNVTRINSVGR
ncbi:hypothetical protein BRD18_06315 [Halobacteriales archaeon SW_7_71_33]|nr:MAG: hypothetical protein BRD18_06315 [Halobacteriales archaeon SW_7_71_33]